MEEAKMTQRGAQTSPREAKDGPKDAKWAARAPKMEPEGAQKRKSGTLKKHGKQRCLLCFWQIGRPGNLLEATTRHQKTPKEQVAHFSHFCAFLLRYFSVKFFS